MTEQKPSLEFEEIVCNHFSSREPDPKFAGSLRRRLIAHAGEKHARPVLRPVWGFALALLAALALTVLAIGSQRVLAAVRGLFGYAPGVGVVSQESPLRMLAEPVTFERDGITLTVTQAVISADKTVLVYRVENIPEEALPVGEGAPFCAPADSLRLPDGSLLQPTGGHGNGWVTGYELRETFEPIPPDVHEAVLLVPCLWETAPGKAPESWELSLAFLPASPEMTMLPVIEVPPSAQPGAGEDTGTATPTFSPLTIERTIELEDGYILIGSFRSISLHNGLVATARPWVPLKFTDANGQEIYADYADDIDLPAGDEFALPWAYHIHGKNFAWPLTITLESVEADLPATATFQFDTGPNPQPDQQWDLNQDLQIDAYTIRILSIIRNPDGYDFFFQADPMVTGLGVDIQGEGQHIDPAGGGGSGAGEGELSTGLTYSGEVPEGKLTVVISRVTVTVPGSWSVQWTPATPPSEDVTHTP